MFDIFAEKEQPLLYIADISVSFTYKPRSNSQKREEIVVNLNKIPIILLNEEFPTERYKDRFLKKIYEENISSGYYSNAKATVKSIKNITFSSKLAYHFDYDKH